MKKHLIAAALLSTTIFAAPASAATTVSLAINTALSGNFGGFQDFNGTSVVTGSFDYDLVAANQAGAVSNFSAAFTQAGTTSPQDFALTGISARYDGTSLIFTQGASTVFSFLITNLLTNNGRPPATATTTTQATSFQYNGITVNIGSGSTGNLSVIEPAVAAVPEPATWGMMLLGFGMIGFGMRRRKSNVRTTVRFA